MRIEVEQEDDGRWLADVLDLPGVMSYGETRERAVAKAEALALRVIADRLDHGEVIPDLTISSWCLRKLLAGHEGTTCLGGPASNRLIRETPGEPACLQEISRPLNFAGSHVPASGTQTFVTITAVPELLPFEFLDRLAELVPPPRKHRLRYHGVFAPNHKLRRAVTALAIGNIGKQRSGP